MIIVKRQQMRYHTKASERYVDVTFSYPDGRRYDTSVPIEYRRTGTSIPESDLDTYLQSVAEDVNPENWEKWRKAQTIFWADKPKAAVTKAFFDVLAESFSWCCVTCHFPQNPNWARRIQDIKEFGYTLATNTSAFCDKCNRPSTQLILLPLKRGGITGYETWTAATRTRIVKVLGGIDSYEARTVRPEGLLPDHKFPEIRWDANTKRDDLSQLTDKQIHSDFQLLSNQRNQQKREVCRSCFQTGKRGVIFGIPYYYKGGQLWDEQIPKSGKAAEEGCVGCGWYDINVWREHLVNDLKSAHSK